MGKRIDQLDPYGSPVTSKRGADLFEVSKNSGTVDTPIYAVGDSRKLTFDELVDAIDCIPFSGENYEVVHNNGTALENGAALIAAIAACNSKTPNGNSLSITNQANIYLWTGDYDISEPILANQLIRFVGIGAKENIKIYSSSSLAYIFVVNSANVIYSLSNLTISNDSGLSIAHGVGIGDVGIWDNLIINAPTSYTSYSGTYSNITATVDLVLPGTINGTVIKSTFKNKSCAYSESGASDITGTIEDCTGIDFCFGVSLVDRAKISGNVIRTTARDKSFAYTESTTGSNGEISGLVDNCHGRDYCFASTNNAGANGVVSGIIKGYSTARSYSFGYSANDIKGYITGEINTAIATGIDSCGFTKTTGIIKNFKGINSRGLHIGLIDSCRFINPSGATKDVIGIDGGGTIKYSTIIQLESTKDCIKIVSGASVKISHCELNQDFNLISGHPYINLINTGYNVIDSDLIG